MPCRMSIGGAPCEEAANPRRAGHCFRCDGPVAPKPEPRPRNLELEREIIRHAARGLCDPSRLIQHAEARTGGSLACQYVADPMTVAPRDHLREAREELPDAAIRLAWWLEENPGHDAAERVLDSLRSICVAYDRLTEED